MDGPLATEGECGFTFLLEPLETFPEASFSALSPVKLFNPFFFGVACEPNTRKRKMLRDSEVSLTHVSTELTQQRKRLSRTRNSILYPQPYDTAATALAMKIGKCNGIIGDGVSRPNSTLIGDHLRVDGPQDEFHR